MKTIKIETNGREIEITLTKKQLEQIKDLNPMTEVFEYHKTTETEFEEKYKDLPNHIKYYALECMVVEYYNKSIEPDWTDSNQIKFYPYFSMKSGKPAFDYSYYCHSTSDLPSRLCFLRDSDLQEAVVKYKHIYEQSRVY